MSIFIDTWGFKAFIDRKEHNHLEVKKLLEKLWGNGEEVVTSDYIIDETITLFSTKLSFNKVKEFIMYLDMSCKKSNIDLLWISEEHFEKAKQLRLKYSDKPEISFTDFTTMILMNTNKICDIITKDKHFTEVNMGFNVLFK